MTIRNALDISSDIALGPAAIAPVHKTPTSYNEPGLPSPPKGWGTKLGTTPALAPDTCSIP